MQADIMMAQPTPDSASTGCGYLGAPAAVPASPDSEAALRAKSGWPTILPGRRPGEGGVYLPGQGRLAPPGSRSAACQPGPHTAVAAGQALASS
jgi:hypothetical protein